TAAELIRAGEIKRSWLGISAQPLLKSGGAAHGVLVGGVVPGSPAEKAGLLPGDILLSYNDKSLDVRHPEQLPAFNRLLLETPIGERARLVYLRGGKEGKASAVTIARGTAEGHKTELKSWGITVE